MTWDEIVAHDKQVLAKALEMACTYLKNADPQIMDLFRTLAPMDAKERLLAAMLERVQKEAN